MVEENKNNNESSEKEVEIASTSAENESSLNGDASSEHTHEEVDSISDDPNTFSSVTTNPKNQKVAFIIFGIAFAFFLYFTITNIILAPTGEEEEEVFEESEIEAQVALEDAIEVTKLYDFTEASRQIPNLPELQPLAEPTPPSPPPISIPSLPPTPDIESVEEPAESDVPAPPSPPSGIMAPPSIDSDIGSPQVIDLIDDGASEALANKRKASITVFGGAQGSTAGEVATASSSSFSGFGDGKLDKKKIQSTSATQVTATHVGDLTTMILQGKIIHGVLETAINTDLEGSVRAIITRDIYAEMGKRVLIPKGSRVVGAYKSEVSTGVPRVGITWSRLIRPDGIDIQIDSQGVDSLGRSGVIGELDNKFWLRLGTAFMVSYLIPVAAAKLANVDTGASTSSSTSTDGTTTSSSTVEAEQLQESSEKFSEIATDVVESTFKTEPTITINQGEVINIFVQKDLIFPNESQINELRSQGGFYK